MPHCQPILKCVCHLKREPFIRNKCLYHTWDAPHLCTGLSRQFTYTSRRAYRTHLLVETLSMIIRSSIAYHSNLLPNPLDPNWYCCVCKSCSKDLNRHRQHLAPVPLANPSAEIAIHDRNYNCAKCSRKLRIPGAKKNDKPWVQMTPTCIA